MKHLKLGLMSASLALTLLLGCGREEPEVEAPDVTDAGEVAPLPAAPPAVADEVVASLQAPPGDQDFTGTVTFSPVEGQGVRVVADVSGVDTDGKHGIHIHENGECAHGEGEGHFTTAGGHFNPTNAPHACPPAEPRHVGDLGNIEISGGRGRMELTTNLVALSGPNSVVGKALILHAGEDDCQTQPTGNSGDRLACGVILAPGAVGSPAPQGQ